MPILDALQKQFALPDLLQFEAGENGLVRAIVTMPHAQVHIYLHGAHVTHYQPNGQSPVLFLSGQSEFASHKAIRGGVPVIFPWFGAKQNDTSAPSHGFARVMDWDVAETKQNADQSVTLTLRLTPTEATQKVWPGSWNLSYRVTVGTTLHLELEVQNTGETELRFEEALHTYFAVGDVASVSLEGLGSTDYLDKTDKMQRKHESADPLHITAETDRVYLDTAATCIIDDPELGRRLTIEKNGSDATVVWNPAQVKAHALKDLGDEEWPHFLCVESGNITPHVVTLAPGAMHTMNVTIAVD